jgi:hypothetical protein
MHYEENSTRVNAHNLSVSAVCFQPVAISSIFSVSFQHFCVALSYCHAGRRDAQHPRMYHRTHWAL